MQVRALMYVVTLTREVMKVSGMSLHSARRSGIASRSLFLQFNMHNRNPIWDDRFITARDTCMKSPLLANRAAEEPLVTASDSGSD